MIHDLQCNPALFTGLGNNTISGQISLLDNAGNVGVEGNVIGGSLACFGNVPAPDNGSNPNTVSGAERGQCTGL